MRQCPKPSLGNKYEPVQRLRAMTVSNLSSEHQGILERSIMIESQSRGRGCTLVPLAVLAADGQRTARPVKSDKKGLVQGTAGARLLVSMTA